jgi:hypothetical protein
MKYIAIYLDETFVGFITEESQKTFLLECDSNYEFYNFTWDSEVPPMPSDIELVDGSINIVKNK